MSDIPTKKSGVAIPPPVVYAAYFIATLLIDWRRPAPFLPTAVQYAVGSVLILAGVCLAALAVREFRRAGTKFDVYKIPTALVTTGVLQRSRNPGYIAVTLAYIGAAIMIDSIWVVLGVLPAIHWTHRKAIAREERQLEKLFGDSYRAYKSRVHRWL